jgi:hypothetical protein
MPFDDAVPRDTRLRRGGALLVGAAVYALLVYGPLEFFWTPFLLGLAYLGAAAVGGRRGGLWATGLVLTGWGAGVLLAKLDFGPSAADAYLIGVGAAALAGGLLARSDFAVNLVGVGATAVAAGLLHMLAGDPIGALVNPWPYVALLGLVGATNLALALAPRGSTARSPTRTASRPGSTAPTS